MSTYAAIIGRIFLAVIFLLAGFNKISDPASTAQFIESATALPGIIALPVGVFELVFGLLLAVGFMTRLSSILLAGFCLLTIFFFHNPLVDPSEMVMALKNLAIAGGLLTVFALGPVRGTLDERRAK